MSARNKRRRKNPTGLIVVAVIAIAIILGIVALCNSMKASAENTMTQGKMTITEQSNGTLRLQWPAGKNADSYTLEILRGEQVLFTDTTKNCYYALPTLPSDTELTIRIRSSKSWLFGTREGEEALEVTAKLVAPKVSQLVWQANPFTGVLSIMLELDEGAVCQMYYTDGTGRTKLYGNLNAGELSLTFGDKDTNDFPVPPSTWGYTFSFDVYTEYEGLTIYGQNTNEFSVSRTDVRAEGLSLYCLENNNNAFTFIWGEVKCDHYEIQKLNSAGNAWETLASIPLDAERTFTSQHLAACEEYWFRVAGVDALGKITEVSELKVESVPDPLYTTVWTVKDLTVYSTDAKGKAIGTAPTGSAFCVLGESNGMFKVELNGKIGYIDSNYCMINLPEYMGDTCTYDIANSYSSVFMAHEYELPGVTDTVIVGYENVKVGSKDYLVPLLYPVAKKLVVAAEIAEAKGFRLKIYDSFRPQVATHTVYNLAESLMKNPLPKSTFSGLPVPDLPDPPAGGVLTYEYMMTDKGRYSLSYFLANGTSNHNLGIAVDLTLERIDSGTEVRMQTSIHDLSWYSEVSKNTVEAKLLQNIMVEAGFNTLVSEWWHFEDKALKTSLKLSAVYNGVSPECWMADDNGWRYRKADGKFYINCTAEINGIAYEFDASGYCTNR